MNKWIEFFGSLVTVIFILFATVGSAIAWVISVAHNIRAGAWVMLLIDGVFVPIGVIHGWMIWFGWA